MVQPEQIFYSPDNETVDGKAPDKEALLRQALVGAGFLDGDGKSNMKGIGPTFTHIYEVQQTINVKEWFVPIICVTVTLLLSTDAKQNGSLLMVA